MCMLELQEVSYTYGGRMPVLEAVSYEFEPGRVYAVTGCHGTGKSTLLYLLAGLIRPTFGQVLFDGRDLRTIESGVYRSRCVGAVFPGFDLLPRLSAEENIQLTLKISGVPAAARPRCAADTLRRVGLGAAEGRLQTRRLRNGSRLRAAVARALCYQPGALLLDQPLDLLDEKEREPAMDFFRRLASEEDRCVILTTVLSEVIRRTDALIELPVRRPVRASRPPEACAGAPVPQ